MDVFAQFSSSFVAAAAVLIVAWLGKERYDAKFEVIDARFRAVDVRFDAVEDRLDRLEDDVRQIRTDIAGVRSDLTQIALAVGARIRPDAS